MKTTLAAGIVCLAITSGAQAQQAVQWKVEDGGNGHWYRTVTVPGGVTWESARQSAVLLGGQLTCLESDPERTFCFTRFSRFAAPEAWVAQSPGAIPVFGPWIGGYQLPNSSEPLAGWTWITGSTFNPFWPWACCNNDCPGSSNEDRLHMFFSDVTNETSWNDLPNVVTCGAQPISSLVEWSADCNNDNIVDYGQCHDGTLPDYNGNNVPDCCERGEACVAGNYPVQWRIEDGGNGHWYQLRTQGLTLAWQSADAIAKADGGYLASILSEDEDIFVFRLSDTPGAWQGPLGPWLGGAQIPGSGEPVGTWIWLSSGDPWTYAGPNSPFADNGSGVDENRLHYVDHARRWNDIAEDGFPQYFGGIRSLLIEWDADCNNDGVVDYGQILQGQLVDANSNGIPDICEGPTCNDIDLNLNGIVDGGDLGVLLAFWGPVSPAFPRADINKDGFVNGADLGIVLAFWGPCPN